MDQGKGPSRAQIDAAVDRLVNIYFDEPIVPATIMRLAIGHLGESRLKDYQLTQAQRNTIVRIFTSAGSALKLRHRQLFADLLQVDWDEQFQLLRAHVRQLLLDLRRVQAAGTEIDGAPTWHWIASLMAIGGDSIGRELAGRLHQSQVSSPPLVSLAGTSNSLPFSPHVHLVAYIVKTFYVTETTSLPLIRDQLTRGLGTMEELEDAADEVIATSAGSVTDCKTCAPLRVQLKGGITAKAVASLFLGFADNATWREWEAFENLRRRSAASRQSPRPPAIAQGAGPKSIAYAGTRWAVRSVWDAIPEGAGLLPAQGQTRSGKGRRG